MLLAKFRPSGVYSKVWIARSVRINVWRNNSNLSSDARLVSVRSLSNLLIVIMKSEATSVGEPAAKGYHRERISAWVKIFGVELK